MKKVFVNIFSFFFEVFGSFSKFSDACGAIRISLDTFDSQKLQKQLSERTKIAGRRATKTSKISYATFKRILAIVPGFFRIGLRFGKILGRSSKFVQKWRFEFLTTKHQFSCVEMKNCRLWKWWIVFWGNEDSSCVGTTNRRVWERGTVLCGNEDCFHLGMTNRCVWQQKQRLVVCGSKDYFVWERGFVLRGETELSWLILKHNATLGLGTTAFTKNFFHGTTRVNGP